jgi:endo-1,4-beta-xylanase
MDDPRRSLSRRSLLLGAAGAAGVALVGCSSPDERGSAPSPTTLAPSPTPPPEPIECAGPETMGGREPLWRRSIDRGLVFGSSATTWQLADAEYRALHARESAILFTEDDLLWYRLKPRPTSELDFSFGDRIVSYAERHGMLVLGAHLVWDEGFGEGWTEDDLWNLEEGEARELLFGTAAAMVRRYRGRIAGWIVVNEALDGFGIRPEVPWYGTIGPTYVEEAFRLARDLDPEAALVLNDFGYETDDGFTTAADKRAVTLDYLDELLGKDVPVDAFGVQAHLPADRFLEGFDDEAYRAFLQALADRGLRILITEMDVLDDGLPAATDERDLAVAAIYRTYLDVALDEPAVASLITFGLSDRYTWLQEDFPRDDGAVRRPLPFDEEIRPKPAHRALAGALEQAPPRDLLWRPPRC